MNGLLDRDAAVFLHQSGSTPVGGAFRAVDGVWVEDADGHRFMDFHGNTCHNIGYCHPRLIAALKEQLGLLPFTPRGFTNEPSVQLAERLSDLWPYGKGQVLFGLSGADAIEMALKLAYVATGRTRTLAFEDSWHGAALGAVWVGGREKERRGFPRFEGCSHAVPFWPRKADEDAETTARLSLEDLRRLFAEIGGFACLLAEPIRSTPHVPPAWYWPEVERLCRDNGTLLIFDEIPTGLGKTGRLFSGEHFDVAPDMTVLGKSLGGAAVPLAAVIARDGLNVAAHMAIGHYTHQKNPLLCRAGLATLAIIEDEELADRAHRMGVRALAELQRIAALSRWLVGARGIGLLMAVEFHSPTEARAARTACFAAGLNASLSEGRFLTLSPPLTITEPDLDHALAIVADAARG